MSRHSQLQNNAEINDPRPDAPDPLSPSRTDLNPSDTPGVDELPDNDGTTPDNSDNQAAQQRNMPDVDPDNAELDDQPNPR